MYNFAVKYKSPRKDVLLMTLSLSYVSVLCPACFWVLHLLTFLLGRKSVLGLSRGVERGRAVAGLFVGRLWLCA